MDAGAKSELKDEGKAKVGRRLLRCRILDGLAKFFAGCSCCGKR